MRRLLAVPLLVAFLLAGAPAQAQEGAPNALLEDGAGDVDLLLSGQPAGSASNLYPEIDLRSLSLEEDSAAFTWTLGVTDVRAGTQETGADGAQYVITFAHNQRSFRLRISHSLPALNGDFAFAQLTASDSPAGPFAAIWSDLAQVDLQANTFTVFLPREALADRDGAAPFPGRLLEGIQVSATSTLSQVNLVGGPVPTGLPQDVQDFMPDDAGAIASYAVQVGVQQTGHARLGSSEPFRASNGEATTFVYEVEASNLGDDNESFELSVTGAPARVSVVLPVPLLAIPAGESLTFPVLATIPFGHQHGGVDRFVLEMTSLSDPASVGRIEMGIRYLAVPQPAGHHDTVWLHLPQQSSVGGSLTSFTSGFMNTLDQDERAGTENWHATGLSFGGTTYSSYWTFELAPGLQMGLDLDGQRNGHVSVPITGTLPLVGASLSGALYVSDGLFGSEGVFLASFDTDAVDIDPNGQYTFEADLVPDRSVRVPYEPGRNLFLDLQLEYQAVPSPLIGLADETPAVAPGGFMQLPLKEWHDDVDDALNAVGGPVLRSLGPQERAVNPGEALVFQAAMTNPTDQDIAVGFEVTGQNAQWATLPETRMVLPAHGNVTVSLIVRPPGDALDGDRADLILQVYPQEMPALRALLRLVANVDTDVDLVDEAPLATQLTEKESPVSPMAGLLAIAAALALASRRR